MNTNKKSFLIVDDHPIFRMGVKTLLSAEKGYTIIAEANHGEEAIDLLHQYHPDYIILDLDMPKMSGEKVIDHILKERLSVKIIVLTAHTHSATLHQIARLQCVSIVFKESITHELVACIIKMEAGSIYMSSLCKKFLERKSPEDLHAKKIMDMLNTLTTRELKILTMIANHYTTNQIADTLHNSYKTIENHRTNISLKLGLKGSNTLLKFAIENQDFINAKAMK
ncbi:MAG: response regulator transcription factor [Bacteroidota bacterium]